MNDAALDAPVLTNYGAASTPVSDFARSLAAEAAAADTNAKQSGIKGIAAGRQDIFRLNPYHLRIKEGWNSRVAEDPANVEHVDHLARSIAEIGVKEPLTVFWENGSPVISDGHCRLLATFRAIEVYGAEIKTVPVKTEDRYASEGDRLLSQIVRNSGKPLSALEQGTVYKRLIDLGWSEKDVAAKVGLSMSRVTQLLELYAAPPAIRALVASGKVSATLAWQTLRSNGGDEAKTIAMLKGAVETARAAGKTKATAKHIESRLPVKRELRAIFLGGKAEIDDRDEETVTIRVSAADFARVRDLLGF